jgi:Myotubularin-like phosphatase domain
LGIGNIHVMRNSQQKLYDHVEVKSSDDGFFSSVSSWLGHLKNILYGARKIAKLLERGEYVVWMQ